MSRWIDGRSALARFDQTVATARRAVSDAIEAAETLSGDLTETRQKLARAYAAFASHQIEAAERGEEVEGLARTDLDVTDLLARHETYLAELLAALDSEAETIAALERERARKASALDKALEAYELKVAEVEAKLEEDETYRVLVEAVAEAEAVSERARSKLNLARSDADEKGEAFRSDPLFMYLWQRGYRTPDYTAGPLTRFLDGWVAGLCHYDRSWRNYQRLVELPDWLEGHVERMQQRQAEAETALETAESAALSEAGADTLEAKVETVRADLARIDSDIADAEARHLRTAERQVAAERGDVGPAAEARRMLAAALASMTVPDLRVLSAQTVTPEDDAIADELVMLRKDEMAMELRLEQTAGVPARRRADLEALEAARRGFKHARLDSPYASFKASALDEMIAGLLAGRIDADTAVRRLTRSVRRKSPRTDPRFGGSRRSGTLGMPDIIRDVGFEILKEMGRSAGRSRGSPWGGPPLPRGRRTKFPRPRTPRPRRRGGFKTGGGF